MKQSKKIIDQQSAGEKERTSLYLKKEVIKNLKYVAFMSEKTQTDIINEALTDYIAKWEKKNGSIPKK
jgi:predicted DNA-binding protein